MQRLRANLPIRSRGRHGGVCISNGRIVAVPYNSAQILEIGERVCMPKDDTISNLALQPVATTTPISDALSSILQPVGMAAAISAATKTFIRGPGSVVRFCSCSQPFALPRIASLEKIE